jgi:glucosamine-6-phosphate deaminase
MKIITTKDPTELGLLAAQHGIKTIQSALKQSDEINLILATGASQFATMANLVAAPVDWSRVNVFHLDEYIGLAVTHAASFRRYLRERFITKLPKPLKAFHEIDGNADPNEECARLDQLIQTSPISVAFVGIGENGHLAFNDPPADFQTKKPFIVVDLDEKCRRQQVGEGWFQSLDEVPTRAISMSCRQILKSRVIVCSVPGKVKAEAIRKTLESVDDPNVPASILHNHSDTTLYLDEASAALIDKRLVEH